MNNYPSTPRIGALILAAGLGSRLGYNTKYIPKCLVPVAGQPILQRMLDGLIAEGVQDITIAVGYLANEIRDFVSQCYPELRVRYVENVQYDSTGSVYSLHLALTAFPEQQDLLLIEGDVVLEPALLSHLLSKAQRVPLAATLLAPYEPQLSGTFALVEQQNVSAWLHESVRAKDFPIAQGFKTVNLTYFRQGTPLTVLKAAICRAIEHSGQKAPLEYAMQDLVSQGMEIQAVGTDGMNWFEVDTPEDLCIANHMFSPQTTGV